MSITEKQFDKLESRVEKLDDKVDGIKIDVAELRSEVKIYTQEVTKHVGGDEKIVTEIMPAILAFQAFCKEDLPQIKAVILEKKAREINETNASKMRTFLQQKIVIVGGILTAISTAVGIWFKFKS